MRALTLKRELTDSFFLTRLAKIKVVIVGHVSLNFLLSL